MHVSGFREDVRAEPVMASAIQLSPYARALSGECIYSAGSDGTLLHSIMVATSGYMRAFAQRTGADTFQSMFEGTNDHKGELPHQP